MSNPTPPESFWRAPGAIQGPSALPWPLAEGTERPNQVLWVGWGVPAAASHLSRPFLPPCLGAAGAGDTLAPFLRQREQCPAYPWLRALPASTLPARPAPMCHGSGWIPSILSDVEFVSTRRVFNPRAPSSPYFSRERGGTKALAGWGRGHRASARAAVPDPSHPPGPGVPQGSRGSRSLLNGSLVPAAPAGHVSRPVPGPRGHRCPRAPPRSASSPTPECGGGNIFGSP